MDFKYFSKNGEILPIADAAIPLSNIEYQYGFGVYESVRLANSVAYFLKEHLERLMESARIIGLEHLFSPQSIQSSISELTEKNGVETCNVKILLVGGRTAADAVLFILCLNPLFPDKKLYKDGVSLITCEYERLFPHAKTLNMLGSFLAYREARATGAYDALLIDRKGYFTEGTRTNFFCMKGKTIFTPRESDILPGVTRKAVLKVAENAGFTVEEKDIRPADLPSYESAFITSTSSKIVPVCAIGSHAFGDRPAELQELVTAFDQFLTNCGGILT
jgi:branched-subunit amino acid aminotransferase/4-amino-4-deoxychorismate lyase